MSSQEERELALGEIVAENNDAFADAIARGDSAAAAAVYAEDAKLLPPGSDPLDGRLAAESFWRERIEMGVSGVELETLELEEHDGVAYEVGRYWLAAAADSTALAIDHGKYVVIHKRQGDGTWKWAVDIFNSDKAPELRFPARCIQ